MLHSRDSPSSQEALKASAVTGPCHHRWTFLATLFLVGNPPLGRLSLISSTAGSPPATTHPCAYPRGFSFPLLCSHMGVWGCMRAPLTTRLLLKARQATVSSSSCPPILRPTTAAFLAFLSMAAHSSRDFLNFFSINNTSESLAVAAPSTALSLPQQLCCTSGNLVSYKFCWFFISMADKGSTFSSFVIGTPMITLDKLTTSENYLS